MMVLGCVISYSEELNLLSNKFKYANIPIQTRLPGNIRLFSMQISFGKVICCTTIVLKYHVAWKSQFSSRMRVFSHILLGLFPVITVPNETLLSF